MQHGQNVPQNLYQVEKIIGKKIEKNKIFYKVKWTGYSEDQSTWQVKSNLKYVTSMIQKFQKNNRTSSINTSGPIEICSSQSLVKSSSSSQSPEIQKKNQPEAQAIKNISTRLERHQNLEKNAKQRHDDQKTHCQQLNLTFTEEKSKKVANISECSKIKKKFMKSQSKSKKQQQKCKKFQKIQLQQSKKLSNKKSQIVACYQEQSQANISIDEQNEKKEIEKKDEKCKEKSKEKHEKIKGEEHQTQQFVKIRLIESDKQLQMRDYVVEYGNGKIKILNTLNLFYNHPVEFVQYLESKAHKGK